MGNLFDTTAFDGCTDEQVETLAESGAVRIERMVSLGDASPEGFWYDQPRDEWVAVVRGSAAIEYADGRTEKMSAGDHVVIRTGVKHRVAYTSRDCIWVAVHYI